MKKKVTVQLRDLYIPVKFRSVSINPLQDEELIQYLMEQMQVSLATQKDRKKQLSVKKATILADGCMFPHEIYPGRVVRTHHNEIGIVTGYRKNQVESEKPISVVLPGHRIWYFCENELFETTATFNEARSIRLDFCRKERLWHEGDSAYLNLPNAERAQIVVGKTSRGVTVLHEVGNTNKITASWNVEHFKLELYLSEFKNEEEQQQCVSPDILLACYRSSSDKRLSLAENLTIFQQKRLELQPTLMERANESMKAFFQQNYNNYLNVISKLEDNVEQYGGALK